MIIKKTNSKPDQLSYNSELYLIKFNIEDGMRAIKWAFTLWPRCANGPSRPNLLSEIQITKSKEYYFLMDTQSI